MASDDTDWLSVEVSKTARQKGFRYLKGFQIEQKVQSPQPPVYYEEATDNWHIIVPEDDDQNSTGEDIHLVVGIEQDPDRKTAVVASQTSKHYDYEDERGFHEVLRIGERPDHV